MRFFSETIVAGPQQLFFISRESTLAHWKCERDGNDDLLRRGRKFRTLKTVLCDGFRRGLAAGNTESRRGEVLNLHNATGLSSTN